MTVYLFPEIKFFSFSNLFKQGLDAPHSWSWPTIKKEGDEDDKDEEEEEDEDIDVIITVNYHR